MAINEKYSNGNFTHRTFLDVDPVEFNDSEIVNSCFYQEVALGHNGDPRQDVFPAGMTGVTFRKCNLDNVVIPPGNTVENCSQRRICVQNDYEDWEVDSLGTPTAPLNPKPFVKWGVSVDPRDIPSKPRADGMAATLAAEQAKRQEADAAADAARDAVLNAEVTP